MPLYEEAPAVEISKEKITKLLPLVLGVLALLLIICAIIAFTTPKPIILELRPSHLKVGQGKSMLKVVVTNTFENEMVASLRIYAADETSLEINPKDQPTAKLAKGESREYYYEVIPSNAALPGKYLITAELHLGEKTFIQQIYLTLEK